MTPADVNGFRGMYKKAGHMLDRLLKAYVRLRSVYLMRL